MSEIVSNSITIFKQTVAPVGWTKLSDIYDCTLRVTNNVYNTLVSGTVPVSNFFASSQTITAPINVSGYVNPAKAELPSHTHIYGQRLTGDQGLYRSVDPNGFGPGRSTFQTEDVNSVYQVGISEAEGGVGSLNYYPRYTSPYGFTRPGYFNPGDCNPHTHPLSGQISMPVTINNTLNIKYVDVIRARRN